MSNTVTHDWTLQLQNDANLCIYPPGDSHSFWCRGSVQKTLSAEQQRNYDTLVAANREGASGIHFIITDLMGKIPTTHNTNDPKVVELEATCYEVTNRRHLPAIVTVQTGDGPIGGWRRVPANGSIQFRAAGDWTFRCASCYSNANHPTFRVPMAVSILYGTDMSIVKVRARDSDKCGTAFDLPQ
ncbi:MAG TPA: hypothetical protein VF608_00310 [Thermoanaerobaculia bacterium]